MKVSATEAEYMELTGAKKDGSCAKVEVPNGISLQRGCCDFYSPESGQTTEFRCGVCEYHMNLKQDADADDFNSPSSDDTTSTPSFPTYSRATNLTGAHIGTPFLQSMKQAMTKAKLMPRSKAVSAAIAKSARARPGTYRFGK